MIRSVFVAFIGFIASTLCLAAQPPATAPTTAPDLASLKVTVTGVEGNVQVRAAEDQPWQKCQPGMVVGTGAEFRTGIRSAVRCSIPPDQTFTIDRLGTVKVLKAIQQGGKLKTDLGMQYGRTRYDIEEAGLEHESTIRSPNGTLAVRGTRVSFYDQPPFNPRVTSLTGRAVYSTARRQMAFGGKGAGKTSISGGTASAAETAAAAAQVQYVIDPRSAVALTQAESQQLAIEISRGAIRFDRLIISGFQPVPPDLAAAGLLPGRLNFTVTWTGFADIDLFVIRNPGAPDQVILGNPSVARLLPGRVVQQDPTGGRIDFDKISIAKGAFEVAYWSGATWKPGVYGLGAIHNDFRARNSGYDSISNLKFEAWLDGKRLNTVLVNPEDVSNGQAAPVFGTSYQTQTNLNTGRDVVSTAVIVPAPGRKASASATPAATPPAKSSAAPRRGR